MRTATLITLALGLLPNWGCIGEGPCAPLSVVENVEIERYMGKWYEIARYPNWFQSEDCVAATAEYTLRDDGTVRVVNTCHQGDVAGPVERIEGRARVVDPTTNAKLKVGFFGPFEGDYWIINLDEDYQWAIVGEPTCRFLWILSRSPTMDDELYDELVAWLADQGYDTDRLRRSTQVSE